MMMAEAGQKSDRSLREQVLRVLDILEGIWHNEENPPELGHEDPLDGLVLTVLSQNTNDRNRDRAYERLREAFPEWSMAVHDPAGIAEAIKPAGLSLIKSQRIVDILKVVYERLGTYSMESLRSWDPGGIRNLLDSFAGVGPKTVACVLLFDFGIPAFPVDTHIARFARRMEWAEERTPPEKISVFFESVVPENRFLGAHVNIIHHGRGLCSARNPKCIQCPLVSLCFFAGTAR